MFTVGRKQEDPVSLLGYLYQLMEKNTNVNFQNINEKFDFYLESLLSGYYDSGRHDMVIVSYLLAYKHIDKIVNMKDINFRLLIPNIYDKKCTKISLNLYLASVKSVIKDNINNEKENEKKGNSLISVIDYQGLWKFTKKILKERMKYENDSENENENNVGIIKSHDDFFDSITIATSIDICNIIRDNDMSYEMYTHQSDILILKQKIVHTQNPSNVHAKIQKNEKIQRIEKMPPRIVHSYLRSFTSNSHLYKLNTFINTIYLKSSLFSNVHNDDEHRRTCDEVIQAYLRCGE